MRIFVVVLEKIALLMNHEYSAIQSLPNDQKCRLKIDCREDDVYGFHPIKQKNKFLCVWMFYSIIVIVCNIFLSGHKLLMTKDRCLDPSMKDLYMGFTW